MLRLAILTPAPDPCVTSGRSASPGRFLLCDAYRRLRERGDLEGCRLELAWQPVVKPRVAPSAARAPV